MRKRTTLILLSLATALGAYIWLVERFEKGTTEKELTAHLVLTLDKAQIDAINIKQSDGTEVVLRKRTGNRWQLEAPIQDRAEKGAVSAILKLASEFEIARTIPAKDVASGEVKVVDLGLDASNSTQVDYASGGKKLGTLIIGNAAPWDGTVYCKVLNDPDREDVYVGATSARPILMQPAEAFRDTLLTAHAPGDVMSISIHQGSATEIELQRAHPSPDAPWLLKKPLQTYADSDMIGRMLGRFLKARIDSFLDAEGDVKPAPSANAVVVTLRTKDGVTTVTLEPDADGSSNRAVVRVSDRNGSFTVSDEFHEMFTAPDESTPLWQLLRLRLLGRINPAAVTTILILEKGKSALPVWLYGNAWYMTRDSPIPETADKARLLHFVNGLNTQEILEFTSDTGENLESFGLSDPRFRLGFSGVTHASKSSPPAIPEDMIYLLIGHGENGRIYAKYEHEPFVYQVSPSVLSLLPLEPIRWKDRNLLAFSQSAVQGIIIARNQDPPVEFKFDPVDGDWTATRSNEDVTSLLDTRKLEELRGKLAVFNAEEWASSFAPLVNLKNHILEIRLIARAYEGDQEIVTRILRFVSTDPKNPSRRTEFYFGSLNDVAEPFLIKRETYEALFDPILKEVPAEN